MADAVHLNTPLPAQVPNPQGRLTEAGIKVVKLEYTLYLTAILPLQDAVVCFAVPAMHVLSTGLKFTTREAQ